MQIPGPLSKLERQALSDRDIHQAIHHVFRDDNPRTRHVAHSAMSALGMREHRRREGLINTWKQLPVFRKPLPPVPFADEEMVSAAIMNAERGAFA